MNWQLNTCHGVQFVYFQLTSTEFAMVIYKTKMSIAHVHCLLRIDGSILPGVFLTSSFCVVPESLGFQSNAASSSLFVHVDLGTRTALVQLIALSQQCTADLLLAEPK